jgi:hypothetical protein
LIVGVQLRFAGYMKKLNYFRLFVFLLVILLASLYELSKDYKKLQAAQEKAGPNTELVQKAEFN